MVILYPLQIDGMAQRLALVSSEKEYNYLSGSRANMSIFKTVEMS